MAPSQDVETADRGMLSGGADRPEKRTALAALGGLAGAFAASSCCLLPLVLFSVGATGPWLGQLAALTPYQPYFIAGTLGILGYGFWTVYFRPAPECAEGEACARPLPGLLVRTGLWSATVIVAVAWAYPYYAPALLGQ